MNLTRPLFIALAPLLLSACGGDGGSGATGPLRQGVFVDAPVTGLGFGTPSQTGLTSNGGAYRYIDGERLQFNIGGIVLGSAPAQSVMLPFNLIPGADIRMPVTENPPGVTNIARLLMTLDSDGDPSNGFDISALARERAAAVQLNFNQSIDSFAAAGGAAQQFIATAAPAATNGQLVSVAAAQSALQQTANQMLGNTTAGNTNPGPPNELPIANAGTSSTVNEGTAVTLNGSGNDPDGEIIAFQWSQLSGTPVALTGADQANVSFTAPDVTGDRTLVFRLVVTDDDLATSQPATVSVTVRDLGGNLVPSVNAGIDQTVDSGAAVTLAGAASDSDGSIAQQRWEQISGTPVTLTGADTATAGFTAPTVNVDTPLEFRFGATDNEGANSVDTLIVTVRAAPPPVNQPPQAFAGPDQEVTEGAVVTLSGSGSDSDGSIASYRWEQVAGTPTVTLTGANTASASFTAPEVSAITRFDFRLTVTDDKGASNLTPEEVSVFVSDSAVAPPQLSIADTSAAESAGKLMFTVTLSRSASESVAVSYATADGSATAPADYTATQGTLMFTPGVTQQSIEVAVAMDAISEKNETFTLTLATPSNASIGDGSATGTIINSAAVVPTCPEGEICVGAAKLSVTPLQSHIDGESEQRLGGERIQKFNLGGFGINPFQNFADPSGGGFNTLTESLTEPAQQRVFVGSRGPEDLHVRAMVMQQAGGVRVVFITLDAIGAGNVIQKGLAAEVVARSTELGAPIDANNILFGQTHSHAGPDLQGLWGGVPQSWITEILYEEAANAVQEALFALKPATLTLKQGQNLDFNNYRRPRVDPGADADGTLTLLQARAKTGGASLGSILQYNAHPVSIDEDPRTPHADYIQGAMDWIESRVTGDGGVALYYNGPIADASGSGSRSNCERAASDADYGSVRCRGEGIAQAARSLTEKTLLPTLAVQGADVTLPVTNPAFFAGGLAGAFNRYYDFTELPTSQIPGLSAVAADLPQVTPTARTRVTRVTIGGAANGLEIVTLPGEATNTFGQYIRGLTPNKNMMLLGLTQNSFGYILPEEEFNAINPSGDAGFLIPFTGYEEFVSLGPLTAPLLRLQAYNPLFGIAQSDPRNLPPSALACQSDPKSYACLANRVIANLDYIQRSYAQLCRENGGPEAFCAQLNPDTAVAGQCRSNGFSEAVCSGLGNSGGGASGTLEQAALDAQARGCDPLDISACLFPFPSNHYTVTAGNSATIKTGRRLNFSPLAMPRNIGGKPIDPTEWNRNDGFSPGPMIMTVVPGLSSLEALKRTYGLLPTDPDNRVGITNIELSLQETAPILLFEVGGTSAVPTATRQLIWSELDVNAPRFLDLRDPEPIGLTDPLVEQIPPEQLLIRRPAEMGINTALIIRPAKNLTPGKRYVVALRKLRKADNSPIVANPVFAACKGSAPISLPPIEARCAQLNANVFPVLQAAGVPIDSELFLAWDFTVASTENTTARLTHMRDAAFAALKKSPAQTDDCTRSNDNACNVPTFNVDTVSDDGDFKRVEGTLKVPSFVLPPDPSPSEAREFRDALVAITSLVGMFPGLGDVLGEVLPLVQTGSLPPNRLHYDPTDAGMPMDPALAPFGDGLPDRLPQGGEQTTRFDCRIAKSAFAENAPAYRPSLYGHGLLGGKSEVGAGNVKNFAKDHGMMFCAIDWFGFATGDVPNVATVLVDASNFPVIPDASQQGFINWMFLSRVMQHAQGFAAHREFQKADGTPVFDRREIFYDGNSQGGILPGPVLAVSKDLNRGVFGVPGMNYSTLLRRSVDFTPYSTPLYLSYQHELDRNLVFGLMQMLWDRSENNGYAPYLTSNGRLDGQDNAVLLHPAYGDHQVSMWTSDVMTRTMDAAVDEKRLLLPTTTARHPDIHPYALIPRVSYTNGRAPIGSAQVIWVQPAVVDPPIDETPPEAGTDPHGYPRAQPDSQCQKSHFLRKDGFIADTTGIANALACRERFGTVPTQPGPVPTGGSSADQGYGGGLTGALAEFFASLNAVVAAVSAGDPAAAQAALATSLAGLVADLQAIPAGDRSLDGMLGLDPATTAQNETLVQRSIEAVVLTGAQVPAWSVPAAQGAPYPYPSGAGVTNQGSGAENLEPINQIRDPLRIGEVRSAHNGLILYPPPGVPGVPMGPDVSRIAAYKFSGGVFIEIPVQVDQRYPYFLANARSTFGIYSGTDEELGYEWDVERWGNPGEDEGTLSLKNACHADYTLYRRGNDLHVHDPVTGLDSDDEIVFMYSDAGDRADPTALPSDPDFDPSQGLQHVVLVDPLNPSVQKWVYLGLKKNVSSKFFRQQRYVTYTRHPDADQWIDRSFFVDDDVEKLGSSNDNYGPNRAGTVCGDASNPAGIGASPRRSTAEGLDVDGLPGGDGDRFPRDGVTVTTDTYRWNATGRWMVRDVQVTKPSTLRNYGADLIDRWKGRAFQQSPDSTVSVVGFEDEQVNWEANSTLIGELCGPVRCIREVWGADSGTNVTKTETFYRDAVASRYHVRVHPIPPDGLYTSWDYNRPAMLPAPGENVPAGRYYSLLRPQGVPVDGVNDDVGQIDTIPDSSGMCLTSDGPQSSQNNRCPLFFDSADPTFNLPLAFNNWEQVSGKGDLGSLVYVFELKGATSLVNPLVVPYYRDDACLDDGTGDDPVARPRPGDNANDIPGYLSRPCAQRQGAHGAHGVHYFFTHDSDNAFLFGKPNTEIDGQWWQIMVPTAQPTNVGARYANVIRAPVQAVVVPRPGTP